MNTTIAHDLAGVEPAAEVIADGNGLRLLRQLPAGTKLYTRATLHASSSAADLVELAVKCMNEVVEEEGPRVIMGPKVLARFATALAGQGGAARQEQAGAVMPRWIIARQTVIDDVPDSRPLLGYTVFADPFTTFETAEQASEALQELKLPLGWVRMTADQEPWASLFPPTAPGAAVASHKEAPAHQLSTPVDPMDWPLPCDVTVGHGTMRKGVSLRTLVLRMKTLYEMATGNDADVVAKRTSEERQALAAKFLAITAPAQAFSAWCCEKGEAAGQRVCTECAETSLAYSAAMCVGPDETPLETGEADAR